MNVSSLLLVVAAALAAGFAASVTVLLASVKRAPVGYEDREGFHFGPRPERN